MQIDPLPTDQLTGKQRSSGTLINLVFLLAGLASNPAGACECLWQGSFSEVATSADLVVLASIERRRGNAADIAVEETLHGEAWQEELRVWMKTGNYCRPDIDDFNEGSRWVFALKKIKELPAGGFNPSTPNVSFGRVGDYALSNCGGYWLEVSGRRASGNLIPGMPRFAHAPKMNPVLIDHIAAFLAGKASVTSLVAASEINPELEALKRDSRSFMRSGGMSPPPLPTENSGPDQRQ